MMVSFNGYRLQNEGIEPMQSQGAKRKADQDGEDYVFHGVTLMAKLSAVSVLSMK